ncbi:MAG TPA: BlaI/MecI/CopY family transcriptional regulator [Opitutaceae bacterium]|jgi:predicted transcriptional regulator|nr:BlaI/MecI/CopY family transcriptional regulator [Opitutaceae bacterium]
MSSVPKAYRPTRLEMELLGVLWKLGSASIREIQEQLPEDRRPEYTTVQTIIYRLEEKGAVERVKKIGNAHIFRPLVTRKSALGALIDDFLGTLGGSHEPLMAHLAESGRLSLRELRELEKLIKERRGR